MRSDVTCHGCGGVSSTVDPIMDISLDVRGSHRSVAKCGAPVHGYGNCVCASTASDTSAPISPAMAVPHGSAVSMASGGDTTEPSSPRSEDGVLLMSCLRRFTRPERLGTAERIFCATCNGYQESTKQLSLRTAPIVLALHLKRFEHTSAVPMKIHTPVLFPLRINLAPYMSLGPNTAAPERETPQSAAPIMYALYAVVSHAGSMDTGHYTCLVRNADSVSRGACQRLRCGTH